MMTAPAPAVAVQSRTRKTLLLQSLKIMKKEPSATQQKKSTKLSSKTTAKLSTSAKRIQKELAEITLNPLLTAVLMYRGEALEDFRGPDCRFVNFKKGDNVFVYYKLAEVSPECWAGSVGHSFGYFPKDFIKVACEYTKVELQIPTNETDFVCFDGGRDDFDSYNVEELLGFLELNDSANEDSEKAIEKVEQFPEVSQDVEPEPKPVVANSEQIESAFSENTMDLEEQFLAQKNHPHSDSQTDNAKVLELLITEDTPVDAADTEDHLEIKVEEPADATPLDNIVFLLYSFLLYFSKTLFTTLPDDTQPGPDFYGLPWKPVVFTVLFGFVSFVVFFWKTILVIMENKKLIEKLKEVISVNISELSELQIVLNEAKLREEKVKLECCRLQKENTMLKKKKEQLQQEVKDWSTSHAELSEQIKSFEKSQKDLQVFLSHKEDTINTLTNCITQLNWLQCESESEDQNREEESDELTNGEVAGDQNKKIKDQIKQMMDVSRTQTTISVVEEDLKLLQLKLRDSMSTKCNLEDQIKKLESNCSSLQSSKVGLEEEFKTLRQKVEILNELYQQNEMALQKKLSQEEYERLEKEQRLSAADEKVVSAVEEVKNYKRRIKEMEEELQKTERSLKNQIAMQEKKAHDNWLKARSAERAIAEEKRETANLRQKLLEMAQKMAMQQEEPVIVKPMPGRPNLQNPPRRGPLSQNGSFGPSPVSGGECSPPLTAEPAGRPPSATLNRRDMPINGFDPGCGPAHMNSSSRSSSPAKVTDEGKVNMAMKGPPPFSGVPFMGPPMGPPMGRPPPPP
ncbi:transport and Golgi organization protein 1 homolog, partial [Marmota monax]|uniref:transport and Golgi organization protein 1 homolog n=1 Tax=Marmota monax TaxID=9995 RepID=UPI0026EE7987